MGFAHITDSAFAEELLHCSYNGTRENVSSQAFPVLGNCGFKIYRFKGIGVTQRSGPLHSAHRGKTVKSWSCDYLFTAMKYYMKAASLLVFVYFLTQILSGEACNISQVVVNAGEDANLIFCRSRNDSSENFRLYRVKKNGTMFFIFPNGDAKGNCTGPLKTFCVERTKFSKYNGSNLLLEIKDTLENDSGLYAVEAVFKKLHSNHKEEIILHVIHLKVNVTATVPPSVKSTRGQDQTTGASSPPTSPVASGAFSLTSIPLIPFLLFQIMIFLDILEFF